MYTSGHHAVLFGQHDGWWCTVVGLTPDMSNFPKLTNGQPRPLSAATGQACGGVKQGDFKACCKLVHIPRVLTSSTVRNHR